jgi:hypothetical protein
VTLHKESGAAFRVTIGNRWFGRFAAGPGPRGRPLAGPGVCLGRGRASQPGVECRAAFKFTFRKANSGRHGKRLASCSAAAAKSGSGPRSAGPGRPAGGVCLPGRPSRCMRPEPVSDAHRRNPKTSLGHKYGQSMTERSSRKKIEQSRQFVLFYDVMHIFQIQFLNPSRKIYRSQTHTKACNSQK